MKAEELRIGNYIQDVGESLNPYRVKAIDEDYFEAGPMKVYPAGMVYEYGIPLTEEWLLKFGFEKLSETFVHKKERLFEINIDGLTHIWDGSFTGASIEYIHQLQNLYFALTGKELELKS